MPSSLAAALLLFAGLQTPVLDRHRAEVLAGEGRAAEAMQIFERLAESDPADTEARLWVARLALRLGRTADAEAAYRVVLRDHPADVDARIGLGVVLTRTGAWRDALAVLNDVEPVAGNNADLLGALARAYRRGGDDGRALEYFRRARALAPQDPDLASGFEAVARTYGHWVAFEGFGQGGAPGAGSGSGWLVVNARVTPRFHVRASGRVQQGQDYTDIVAGGGGLWRATAATTAAFRVTGGLGNVALPTVDLAADIAHYAGVVEYGVGIRRLSFAGAGVTALSPVVAWDAGDRWRLDVRYTFSHSSFDATGESSGDHSILLRETWARWRRVALQAAYAYGIESFEELTVDRLGALGTTTLSAGARFDLPSLTRLTATWEHQWRSNETRVDRVTMSIVQSIP